MLDIKISGNYLIIQNITDIMSTDNESVYYWISLNVWFLFLLASMCHSFTLSPWFFKISSFLPLSFIILQRMHPKEILFPFSKVHCFAYIRIASHRISNIFGLTRYFLWLSLHLQQYFVWQAKNQNSVISMKFRMEKNPIFARRRKRRYFHATRIA